MERLSPSWQKETQGTQEVLEKGGQIEGTGRWALAWGFQDLALFPLAPSQPLVLLHAHPHPDTHTLSSLASHLTKKHSPKVMGGSRDEGRVG